MRVTPLGWLARLDPADSLVTSAPLTAVWLSGQVRQHSHLSTRQVGLMAEVADAGWSVVPGGLPFSRAVPCSTTTGTGPCDEPALPVAAVRSLTQYLEARRLGAQVASFLQPVVDATRERLLVVVGSAGAQMLTAACDHLVWPRRLELDVIALGPVGRLPRRARTFVVQARRDRISRRCYHGPVDEVVPGTHMGYPERPEVARAVRDVASRWASAAQDSSVGRGTS